ncbi:FAD-binding oxidoreductase [Nocardiopsis sp. NPDC006139]|uniref:FAD-binding oxidoreductase n=1 Tax=Nocardiopsis sp. NPDC006139 TaxID=3154578 RepID=UPI0033BA2BE1
MTDATNTTNTTNTVGTAGTAARDLAARLRGAVHAPGSPGHERAGTGVQLLNPHRPAAVVEAAGADDVRAAVAWAAGHGLPVAVQATGHGRGTGLAGGVLVATHRMDGVRVDPARRTARIGAGATWRRVIGAAAPHGLAPLSGSAPSVGAVGYTLGGGVGLLARRYGFAADHVRRVDLVTADGTARTVTADTDPELFWALRGGGGDLGIVTAMEVDLFPVERLYGGGLLFDLGGDPARVLGAWWDWARDLPEEMTSGVSLIAYPDLPGLPPHLRGRHLARVAVSWSGPVDAGPLLVEPLRSAGPLLEDTTGVLPYTRSGEVFADPDEPAAFRGEGLLLDDLPVEDAAAAAVRAAEAPFMSVMSLRHLGGALSRPPRVPGAVGHRGATAALTLLTLDGSRDTPAMADLRASTTRALAGRTLGRSLTLSFGEMDPGLVRTAFSPADHARLVGLRGRLDPRGLVHSHRPLR